MRKVKVLIPAKINLTLDVVGVLGGYHNLSSLVASVNLYDAITLIKRKDSAVTVKFKGLPIDCDAKDSNVYDCAKKLVQHFDTTGIDVIVDRKIPSGAGLGGSSADSAGVIVAFKKLFSLNFDTAKYAENFGSDTPYMTVGGFAVIKGRGEKITAVSGDKFYLNILLSDKKISTKECFYKFDKSKTVPLPKTDLALKCFSEKKYDEFLKTLKNDLYNPSVSLEPSLKDNYESLCKYGSAVMTGSGSAIVGVYTSKAQRDTAYKKLKKQYGKKILKAYTL